MILVLFRRWLPPTGFSLAFVCLRRLSCDVERIVDVVDDVDEIVEPVLDNVVIDFERDNDFPLIFSLLLTAGLYYYYILKKDQNKNLLEKFN